MEILFMILQLLCGLAVFLYGMDVMGDALKKAAGTKLKSLLGSMTSNPIKGFLLGLVVTMVIQSSSATTVMVVGFVNSGTMTLLQSVGVIIGANLGTAITAWLTAPAAMGEQKLVGGWADLLKTDAWMPVLAVIGIILIMFSKRGRKKDIGTVLIGFSVLMVGMELMSGAVSGLDKDVLAGILTVFKNPILGVLAGLLLTVIVQSSSASVGILQTLTAGGNMTFGMALPIVVGQNIGTCVTAMLSSIGANKNGRRAAVIHLAFNVLAAVIVLPLFYLLNWLLSFVNTGMFIDAWWIAIIHTTYKLVAVVILFPFYKWLEKLSRAIVRDKKEDDETVNLLDERLFETPGIAAGRANDVALYMAEISFDAFKKALALYQGPYDAKLADEIRDLEEKADKLEDALGSYLVKLSSYDMDPKDSEQITKLLHTIGDLERISDHAVNIVESAEEIKDKKIAFSVDATGELAVLQAAVSEILELTCSAFVNNDIKLATEVEPLEEVIDDLRDTIKLNHIHRLQKSTCTIEHGFVLSDLLTNFERVSDHCSNIAGCVVEISRYDALDVHKYVDQMKHGSDEFRTKYEEYKNKYSLAPAEA